MIDPTRLLRGAVLALALLFLAPLAGIGGPIVGVEAAQAATVTKITVIGNSRVDAATVDKYLALNVGDVVTAAKLSESVDSLQATGLFKTVSVTMQGSILVVKVSENPIAAAALFEGNQRFSDANLIAMIDLMNRGTVDEAGLARDVASITQAYKDAGYSNVGVTTRLEPVGDGRVRVVFVINEGVRNGIAAINFTGNNAIGSWTLKSIIKTHETSWLSWLLKDDSYTQDQLDGDRALIQQYYANHGYPDAQVPSATAEFDAKKNGYFINFTVVEGNHYKFGKIGVETSISGLDANQLTNTIRTHQGDGFSASDMQQTAQDMAVEATGLGYPFGTVRPRVDRDPTANVFNVTYLIDEGQHVYIERINITGNVKTRDFVIRRELGFGEGDPFNQSLVAQAKTNINALGFFSNVDIQTEPGSAPDKVVLDIAVTEQSTGDYGVSLGFDSQAGILGTLSVSERNFLGRGQYISASIGASQAGQTYDFAFTEPYFMGLKMSAGIDVYRHVTDETSDDVYGTTTTGAQLNFGLPITPDLTGTVFTGFDQTTIADATSPFSPIFNDGDTFNKASVGYNLRYDTLDDEKHPTTGLVASFTQEYDGLDYNFIKTEAKARYFIPILPESGVIGSIKLQAGIENSFGGSGVSPLQTFTYGNSIVRGFAPREMGPMLLSDGEAVGFTSYAAASAEVDFPIPMLPETYGLSAGVWGDAGVIGGNGATGGNAIDPNSIDQPLKSSVGASILWDSPFGPLRGDFALPLTYSTSEKAHLQYFSLTLQNLL
ncbi:MAG TPA: outer membrane protein assembly factor BamA [Devosia sp.]|nr:outer membrane protein assembly factor BamA [Devosia sp.]